MKGRLGRYLPLLVIWLPLLINAGHVMGFTCGQYDTDGKACGIAAEMDFGGEPAARTAKCLKLRFPGGNCGWFKVLYGQMRGGGGCSDVAGLGW